MRNVIASFLYFLIVAAAIVALEAYLPIASDDVYLTTHTGLVLRGFRKLFTAGKIQNAIRRTVASAGSKLDPRLAAWISGVRVTDKMAYVVYNVIKSGLLEAFLHPGAKLAVAAIDVASVVGGANVAKNVLGSAVQLGALGRLVDMSPMTGGISDRAARGETDWFPISSSVLTPVFGAVAESVLRYRMVPKERRGVRDVLVAVWGVAIVVAFFAFSFHARTRVLREVSYRRAERAIAERIKMITWFTSHVNFTFELGAYISNPETMPRKIVEKMYVYQKGLVAWANRRLFGMKKRRAIRTRNVRSPNGGNRNGGSSGGGGRGSGQPPTTPNASSGLQPPPSGRQPPTRKPKPPPIIPEPKPCPERQAKRECPDWSARGLKKKRRVEHVNGKRKRGGSGLIGAAAKRSRVLTGT